MTKAMTIIGLLLASYAANAAQLKATPAKSSPAALRLSDCAVYDEGGMSYGSTSTAQIATAYMNGALNRLTLNNPKASDIAKRDACVLLALQNGADANNKKAYEPPIIMAATSGDALAVHYLLQFKANPNAIDSATMSDIGMPVLHRACESGVEQMALDLLAAGADPAAHQALEEAASNAEVNVVDAMLKTGKVPVDQLSGNTSISDSRQTALDSSELRISVLQNYLKKFKSPDSKFTVQDKIDEVNDPILFAYYIGKPNLKKGDDPDAFVNDLLSRQQKVSELLKKSWMVLSSTQLRNRKRRRHDL